jgi:hypothetical protein
MQNSRLHEVINGSGILKSWIELNEWIRPQDAFIQARIHKGIDAGIPDPNEAPDVG